ncbi:MAG: hypothetical protein JWN48_1183 [Myxococcaceae bacterium]|nr:hypothetical protein [Myxococcaceae bacterium]
MTVEVPQMTGGLPKPAPRAESFRRGLVLGPLEAPENDDDFKRKHIHLLDRAVSLGVTDLQLVVRWLQVDYSATEVAPFDSVHDELLTWLFDQAKRRKLRVLVTPRLEVENEGLHSGGSIEPDNWEHWWWAYRRVALHYARLCAMRKVAALSIGSELSSTEGQSERWRKLIKEARKIYKGELTYIATPETVDKVAFWDELDVVSVAVDQAQPRNEEQLTDKLAQLTKRLSRSPKLREFGYVIAETGCGRGDPDTARELLCQYSLFQGLRDEPKLEGVYLQPSVELGQKGHAKPKGQTSSDIVSHWYKKSRS